MKRYTRMAPNAMCMIPRKAIAWIILAMAIMTMFALMLIEVRRIFDARPQNIHPLVRGFIGDDVNNSEESLDIRYRSVPEPSSAVPQFLQTKAPWHRDNDSNAIEALFDDHPNCRDRPYLLILVTSGPENFERREAIRKSWADPDGWKLQVSGLKSKTLFLIGRSTTKFLNILLKNENEITNDILVGDYLDTYRNLTTKVMHGFTWAVRHCQPTYLLKTDDDCFVNVPLLLQFLLKYNPVPVNLYAGKIRWSAPVIRDPNSRWYVSRSEYPKPRYAPYAIGAGYVFSFDVLEKLLVFSDKMHIFPNEDAYVGTVLNAAGVRPTYSERFVTHPGPWQVCNFLYLFVVHKVKASRQNEYKDTANNALERCSLDNIVKDWV